MINNKKINNCSPNSMLYMTSFPATQRPKVANFINLLLAVAWSTHGDLKWWPHPNGQWWWGISPIYFIKNNQGQGHIIAMEKCVIYIYSQFCRILVFSGSPDCIPIALLYALQILTSTYHLVNSVIDKPGEKWQYPNGFSSKIMIE